MSWQIQSGGFNPRHMRLLVRVWLPVSAAWLVLATVLGLEGAWLLMGPPMLLFVLIGWLREPGRLVQALAAAFAFLAIGYWWFA